MTLDTHAAHVISKAELNFLGREWWNSRRMLGFDNLNLTSLEAL